MPTPLQIVFRHTDPSPAVTQRVELEAAKLGRLCGDITRCRVVIEAPHPHHRHGGRFSVRIELRIPRHEIVVHHDPAVHRPPAGSPLGEADAPHKDVYITIRDAFDVARRRLEDQVRRPRTKLKAGSVRPGAARKSK